MAEANSSNSPDSQLPPSGAARHSIGWSVSFIFIAIVSYIGIRTSLPVSSVPEGLDPDLIRTGLAILVFGAVLWFSEALPLPVTSLSIPVVAALSGVFGVAESFSSFAHPLIYLFLGGFALAAALTRHGLDRYIVRGALVIGKRSFYRTSLILFLFTAFLSMWISNTATTTLIIPIGVGILQGIALRDGSSVAAKATPFLLLGIAYSASLGGIATLTGTAPVAIAAERLDYTFTEWMKVGLPYVLIFFPLMCVILYLVFKPGKIGDMSDGEGEELKLSRGAIGTLIVFGLTLMGWLLGKPLSSWLGIDKSFDSIVAVVAIFLLSACRLVSWKEIDKTADWGVLILFGGGLTLSKVLGTTGASLFLAERIQAVTTGWPLVAFILILALFVIFLTELSSNTATTALLVPIFAVVAPAMGLQESELVVPITLAACCAFMLPIATPANAIAYATGRVTQKQMIRVGVVLNLVFALAISLLTRLIS